MSSLTEEERTLCQDAVDLWGTTTQFDMIIEECSELIKAIIKYRRDKCSILEVIEEAVDVDLMLNQLKVMTKEFHAGLWKVGETWNKIAQEKRERLRELIEQEKVRMGKK
jgi:hypothetical protein